MCSKDCRMCIIKLKNNLKDCTFSSYYRKVGSDLELCSKVTPVDAYPFKLQVLNNCILFKGRNTNRKWLILEPNGVYDYIANYIMNNKIETSSSLFSRMKNKKKECI